MKIEGGAAGPRWPMSPQGVGGDGCGGQLLLAGMPGAMRALLRLWSARLRSEMLLGSSADRLQSDRYCQQSAADMHAQSVQKSRESAKSTRVLSKHTAHVCDQQILPERGHAPQLNGTGPLDSAWRRSVAHTFQRRCCARRTAAAARRAATGSCGAGARTAPAAPAASASCAHGAPRPLRPLPLLKRPRPAAAECGRQRRPSRPGPPLVSTAAHSAPCSAPRSCSTARHISRTATP